ncbi:hypothetical protein B296_00005432 [Ensete ventricosum]|uniref:Uncharacterized protein n=1 Tax=Ensete ventricosum TaxID=4639 RepID=A0A427A865_ENSVE|nr:hypothetical protein B296_00005432 [Ensete ventricosum]
MRDPSTDLEKKERFRADPTEARSRACPPNLSLASRSLLHQLLLYTGFRRHKGCCCFEASSVTLSPLLRVRSA